MGRKGKLMRRNNLGLTFKVRMSLLFMAIIRIMLCVVLIVGPGPISTWSFALRRLSVSGGL